MCGNGGISKYTSQSGSIDYKYNYCPKCDVIFIESVPLPQDVVNLYADDYSGYSNLGILTRVAQDFSMFLKNALVKKYFGKQKISKAVEIGPGLNPMLRKKQYFRELIYIDLPHTRLRKAYKDKIKFIETLDASGALNDIKECDLIVANQLIEHLLDPNLFMSTCYQSLKKGGVLFLETPNFFSWEFKIFQQSGNWGGFHTPKHFNIFSGNSMVEFARQHGFSIVNHCYIHSPFLWSESMQNYIGRKKFFNFFKSFFSIKNPIALLTYLLMDSLTILMGLNTSNQRIILRKDP
jgi:predicted SAM-dependent methyltransferase